MRIIRYPLVAAVIACSLALAWAFVWRPLACHRLAGQISFASYAGYDTRSALDMRQARERLDLIERCMTPGCVDVRMMFIAAINYRTLGRNEVALRIYEDSLTRDRRPETFANIADTRFALGDRNGAYENFLDAALFFPGYLSLIDDGEIRDRVRAEVLRRQPEQARTIERIDSGDFRSRFGSR